MEQNEGWNLKILKRGGACWSDGYGVPRVGWGRPLGSGGFGGHTNMEPLTLLDVVVTCTHAASSGGWARWTCRTTPGSNWGRLSRPTRIFDSHGTISSSRVQWQRSSRPRKSTPRNLSYVTNRRTYQGQYYLVRVTTRS